MTSLDRVSLDTFFSVENIADHSKSESGYDISVDEFKLNVNRQMSRKGSLIAKDKIQYELDVIKHAAQVETYLLRAKVEADHSPIKFQRKVKELIQEFEKNCEASFNKYSIEKASVIACQENLINRLGKAAIGGTVVGMGGAYRTHVLLKTEKAKKHAIETGVRELERIDGHIKTRSDVLTRKESGLPLDSSNVRSIHERKDIETLKAELKTFKTQGKKLAKQMLKIIQSSSGKVSCAMKRLGPTKSGLLIGAGSAVIFALAPEASDVAHKTAHAVKEAFRSVPLSVTMSMTSHAP